jgi:hypothetical protein
VSKALKSGPCDPLTASLNGRPNMEPAWDPTTVIIYQHGQGWTCHNPWIAEQYMSEFGCPAKFYCPFSLDPLSLYRGCVDARFESQLDRCAVSGSARLAYAYNCILSRCPNMLKIEGVHELPTSWTGPCKAGERPDPNPWKATCMPINRL